MAYDERLAERVREKLAARRNLTERKMFGGIVFMVGGNIAVGVLGDDLMVRLDPEEYDAALDEPGTRVFDMTGRVMSGWLVVGPESTATDDGLAAWVERGAAFAESLPSKS